MEFFIYNSLSIAHLPHLDACPAKIAPVDLGLPSGTRWAPMNVGATTPEEYGGYFAWGETEPKSLYGWNTYRWTEDDGETFSKYSDRDGLRKIAPTDDAASATWGLAWRMPTFAEWQELNEICSWTWSSVKSVKGYTVTGPNGNSIFLPAAGFRYGTCLSYAGSYGYYWSSELAPGFSDYASFCHFNAAGHLAGNRYFRCGGRSVRAVASR